MSRRAIIPANQQEAEIAAQALSATLAPALSQLSEATLYSSMLHVSVPEFSGTVSEDIHDWLERYETSTFSLPESRKKILLALAFKGTAKAWFSRELKPLTENKTWDELKRAILERFSSQQPADKHLEKLSKLKYDQEGITSIQSFFDEYIFTYEKAHPKVERTDLKSYEKEMTRALVLAIPPEVKSQLNLLVDLPTIEKLEDLRSVIKRYDNHVRLDVPKRSGALDENKFKEIMTGVVKDMIGEQSKAIAAIADQTAIVAAFARRNDQPPRDYRGNRDRPYKRSRPEGDTSDKEEPHKRKPGKVDQSYRDRRGEDRDPPYPCTFCGENHWHSQCPKRDLKQ